MNAEIILNLIIQGVIALGTLIIAFVAIFPRRFSNVLNRVGDIQNTFTINTPSTGDRIKPPLSKEDMLHRAQMLCPHIQYEIPDEHEIKTEGQLLKLNSLFHTYSGTMLYFCHVCNFAAPREKAEFIAMQWYRMYDENNPIKTMKKIVEDIDNQWKKYDDFTKEMYN